MFSKQLILKTINYMPTHSHNALDREIINLDLDSRGLNFSGSIGNKLDTIQNYLLQNPDARDNHGDSILLRMMNTVVNKVLHDVENGNDEFNELQFEFESDKNFYRYLRLDGYDIDFEAKCIIEDVANLVGIYQKNDEIINFLTDYKFNTTLGHYNQAKSSYLNGNLAALNGQLRAFVESIFMDMATYIKIKEKSNPNLLNINNLDATQSMIIFTKSMKPILDINLNEWSSDNKGYFCSFWKRLHPQGSHAGLPDLDEALYRFQLVVLNIELLINRFKKGYPIMK